MRVPMRTLLVAGVAVALSLTIQFQGKRLWPRVVPVRVWADLLTVEDETVQEAALAMLVRTGHSARAVVPEVVRFLARAEPSRQGTPADRESTLGGLLIMMGVAAPEPSLGPPFNRAQEVLQGLCPGALEAVGALAATGDEQTRIGAALAMEHLADSGLTGRREVDAIARALCQPGSSRLRAALARALGGVGAAAPRVALDLLLALLVDSDPAVAAAAAVPVGLFGGDLASAPAARLLVDLTTSDHPALAAAAIRGLSKMRLDGRHGPVDRRGVLTRAIGHPASEVREAALDNLDCLRKAWGTLEAHMDLGLVRALLGALRDPSERVAGTALHHLWHARAFGAVVVPELARLAADRTCRFRVGVIERMETFSDQPFGMMPVLRRLMADPDVQVRAAATGTMARVGRNEPGALGDLADALSDPHPIVRRAAVEGIRWLYPVAESIVRPLLVACIDEDTEVSRRAIEVTRGSDRPRGRTRRALRLALQDSSADLRRAAVRVMSQMVGDVPGVLDDLVPLLADPEEAVRLEVARALGGLGARARPAMGALERRAGLERGTLQVAVADALVRIRSAR